MAQEVVDYGLYRRLVPRLRIGGVYVAGAFFKTNCRHGLQITILMLRVIGQHWQVMNTTPAAIMDDDGGVDGTLAE